MADNVVNLDGKPVNDNEIKLRTALSEAFEMVKREKVVPAGFVLISFRPDGKFTVHNYGETGSTQVYAALQALARDILNVAYAKE